MQQSSKISWSKIIFRIAVSLLFIWIIVPIICYLLKIEIIENPYSEHYFIFRFLGVPGCILLTLIGTIDPKFGKGKNQITVILTIGAAVLAFIFMLLVFISSMCGWYDAKVLFTNKKNPNLLIVERSYGCGALDSDPPTKAIFQFNSVSKYFNIVNKIDPAKIDKSEWVKQVELEKNK